MKHLLIVFLSLALLSFNSDMAEDFTVYTSQTFTGPFSNGVVATSSSIANSSGNNAVKLFLKYEDIVPDVCDCSVMAVIEEEIATNVWVAAASTFEGFAIEGANAKRVIQLSPRFNASPGVDEVINLPDGNIRLSNTTGVAPDKFRLKLLVTNYGPNNLQSLTVSAYGRKFNE